MHWVISGRADDTTGEQDKIIAHGAANHTIPCNRSTWIHADHNLFEDQRLRYGYSRQFLSIFTKNMGSVYFMLTGEEWRLSELSLDGKWVNSK